MKKRRNNMAKDIYTKQWIIDHGVPIVNQFTGMTVRQLYYRLVSDHKLPNSQKHYKRVVDAMTEARWKKKVGFNQFIDRERGLYGQTAFQATTVDGTFRKNFAQVKAWMSSYHKNRWENQDDYIEVWVEKKALQGVFERPCDNMNVALGPCKGYPSLTFLNEARHRFREAKNAGKTPTILYFGDYDPSGQDIPRSLEENIQKMGSNVQVEHVMLHVEQIEELGLPGVPPKGTDSRTANWEGAEAVELDAVNPTELRQRVADAIEEHFDWDRYDELEELEKKERKEYTIKMKEAMDNLDIEELLKTDDDDE